MPKHVFEGKDPLKFDFNPPVSLGAYTLHSYDPNGQWFTWQKRDDWQRTTLARFGEPGPKIRRLSRSRPAGQARDRPAQPRARHHPRHLARGHVHAGQAVADLERLVRGLPLRPSRSDAAAGDLQPPEPEVPEPRRALGAGAGDRHQGGVDGVLSRRRDDLGDRRPADRHASGLLSQADGGLAHRLRDRHRQAEDQALRSDDRQADRRHAAALDGRPDPDRPEEIARARSASAGGSRTSRRRPSCWSGPASPAAATTGTCRTASASRSS